MKLWLRSNLSFSFPTSRISRFSVQSSTALHTGPVSLFTVQRSIDPVLRIQLTHTFEKQITQVAIRPQKSTSPTSPKNERQADISSCLVDGNDKLADDFSVGNFLDDINLDDLFIRIDCGDDDIPDLEVDPDILAEFSSVESEVNNSPSSSTTVEEKYERRREEEEKALKEPTTGEDRREGSVVNTNSSASDVSRGRKPATKVQAKESQGKRKVKVNRQACVGGIGEGVVQL